MTEILPGTRFKPSPFCAYQVLDESAILVSTRDRRLHQLDEVGTDLWRGAESGRSFEEIVRSIVDAYEVSVEEAEADARTFFAELAAKGLIEIC